MGTLTPGQAKEAVAKYGGVKPAARALQCCPRSMRQALKGRTVELKGVGAMPTVTMPATDAGIRRGISVRDFMGRFNYGQKLADAIRKLCRNDFVLDSEIRAAADIPVAYFRGIADLPEFADNKVKDGDKIYWSSAENVARVKAEQKKWGIVR